MANSALETVMNDLRRVLLCQGETGVTDSQLLGAFIERGDEFAFETLVRRHGPMVLGVCRRILGNAADADDAFQATFLVLVRKAPSIRPRGKVGHWLYGVARSTALKARAMSSKRAAKERAAACRNPAPAENGDGLIEMLDEELPALPEKYRAAIVLCDLEGRSLKDAARQLGCPLGTVGTRLARGRALLAGRLARRGVSLPAGALAAAFAQGTASAALPPALVSSTVMAATATAAGPAAAAGVISAHVAALTEGVLKAMLLAKLKIATACVVALSTLGLAASWATQPGPAATKQALAADALPGDRPAQAIEKPAKPAQTDFRRLLQGTWISRGGLIPTTLKIDANGRYDWGPPGDLETGAWDLDSTQLPLRLTLASKNKTTHWRVSELNETGLVLQSPTGLQSIGYMRVVAQKPAEGWGEPAGGVKIRARLSKTEWRLGEKPELIIDLDNETGGELAVRRLPRCEVEVDGEWYVSMEGTLVAGASSLRQGDIKERFAVIRLAPQDDKQLAGRWIRKSAVKSDRDILLAAADPKNRLTLTVGKHAIRVATEIDRLVGDAGVGVGRAVSNRVEIEIVEAK
jgi:RNA polymerase sigma factor (sigma-70 family)